MYAAGVESLVVVVIVAAVSGFLGSRLGGRDHRAAAGLWVVAAMFGLDPYAWGGTGGDMIVPPYAWQIAWAVMSVLVIALAFACLRRGWTPFAFALVAAELVAFAAVNWILVSRDGSAVRTHVGFEASPRPQYAALVGVAARAWVLYVLRNPSRSSLKENSAVESP